MRLLIWLRMCIGMLNRLNVNSYFKIISLIVYLFTLLICRHYLGILLLSGILLFVFIRMEIDFKMEFIFIYILIFMILGCLFLHLHFIYILKLLLIVYYFKYLIDTTNCLELDFSFTKIFKYNLFILLKKYESFKSKYNFYLKTNISIYGKKKRFNALYLAYKYGKYKYNKSYVIRNSNRCLYDYLFVFMHICAFVFVFLLEVYK